MSRLLVAGDWHGNWTWAKKIIDVAVAEGIDKVIQVGDFGVWPSAEGKEYLLILSRYLVKQSKKSGRQINLYFLPGNHEDYNQIDHWVNTIEPNEDGHREIEPHLFYTGKVNSWIWDNKTYGVVGGAVSIDRRSRKINESWWPQEILSPEEREEAKNLGKVDYLFTHDCPTIHPFNFLINHLDSTIHRQYMTEIASVLRPDVWFHGHYHHYAQYPFYHDGGSTQVYSLDADVHATQFPSLQRHAAVLDTELELVYSIDKQFEWFGQRFYFDKEK